MKVQVLKCPECRAIIEIENEVTTCYCKYCGVQMTVEDDSEAAIKAKVRQKELEHEADMRDKQYNQEIKRIKIEKKEKNFSKMLPFLMICGIILLSIVYMPLAEKQVSNQELRLETIVGKVRELIELGKYDEAYIEAQSIVWNNSYKTELVEKWNLKRESLLDKINKEKLAKGIIIILPTSAVDYKSKNYNDIVAQLKNFGFINIKSVPIYDLTTGWLVSDGSVEEISINGNADFKNSDAVSFDAQITVKYHTFKKNEP